MRLNLRKANKLRKEIEGWLANARLDTSVSVNVDEPSHVTDPMGVVEEGRKVLMASVERQIAASELLARLRVEIAAANVSSGVDAVLAQAASVDRAIKVLSKLESTSRPETAQSLAAKVTRHRDALGSKASTGMSYYDSAETTISVGVVDADTAAAASARIVELRRQKEAIEDKRLGLNAVTEIQIGEGDVGLLKEIGLV